MLIKGYKLNIFNNECMPGAMSVQCHAALNGNAGPALPYLNAELGGFEYTTEPPSVTFKIHGKLLTVHEDKIAVNALHDEAEARKIVEWIIGEINQAWENRDRITPSFEGAPRPQLLEILKLLPRTNCGECGRPTCLVFASQATEGVLGAENCPALDEASRAGLSEYLSRFKFI